ncbi:Helix-turn-helix domain-containing protein [Methanoculleus thermophilus]|jgi:DNA-binding transcriptional ArsR family regulator|uniref:Helix-turn-helix domain-containing protein n=2 Tax=Methanoculleus thermophilus TaxID=2200 RepID=A0A1G9AZH1_9EURY|nr:Helix-turn-helix domain-containing protein [Methanoculleus thermophilus]
MPVTKLYLMPTLQSHDHKGSDEDEQFYGKEIQEVRSELAGLRSEIRRFIEHASRQNVDAALSGLRREYADLFIGQNLSDAGQRLQERMIRDCPMRERCYAVFYEFLKASAEHIRDGEVSEEVVRSYRDRLATMRKAGKLESCATCFAETNRLFEKQLDLMRSLGVYRENKETSSSIADLPGEVLVREILEPLANRHRFRIVQALAAESQTFSSLSNLTDLRGGNLLFHLKKLQDAGLILQRHERGDYIITDKGYKALTGIGTLYAALGP